MSTLNGIALIARERQRQQEVKGFTPKHDDQHGSGELSWAAALYVLPPEIGESVFHSYPGLWPWESAFKPGDRIRELTKAGALTVAEIERLLRAGHEVA